MLALAATGLVLALAETALAPRYRRFWEYRKVGGLHFVRIGRFGASFYVTRKHG